MGEESYVTVAQFNVEGGAATIPGKQETPHLKTPPPYLSWTHCCLENIITIRTRGHVIVLQELQVTLNTPASVSAKFCKSRDSDNLSCVVVTR